MKLFQFRRHEVLSILAAAEVAGSNALLPSNGDENSTNAGLGPSLDQPKDLSASVRPGVAHRDAEEISMNTTPGASPRLPSTSPESPSAGRPARHKLNQEETADIVAWLEHEQAALEKEIISRSAGSPIGDKPVVVPTASRGPQDALAVRAMGSGSRGLRSQSPESIRGGLSDRRNLPATDLDLNLLIDWQPAWRSFVSAIRPAFLRQTTPLAIEVRCTARFDPWSACISAAAHVALFLVLIGSYQAHHASQVLLETGAQRSYDVIYFSGPYLPPLEDRGGALIGVSGRSGGRELKNVQNIRVARGTKVAPSTVDAPNLKLPHTDKAVANLLAVRPLAPSAPVQALRSMLGRLGFTPDVVPPAPKVDITQRPAPQLSAEVVPPSPDATSLNQKSAAQMKIDAVPAPVSAPVRDTDAIAKLRLPAEVVAPPPSGISRARALPHGMSGSPQVAPPSPDITAVKSGSPNGSPQGLGSADAVPPPPSSAEIGDGTLNSALNALSSAVRAAGFGKTEAPGVIASAHPGKDVGIPNATGAGEIALSTTGGDSLGRGGSGGGAGIGNGTGPGNAPSGNGPGSGIADIGPGAASGRGNSPFPGDGGAGNSPVATSSSGVWVASKLPSGSVNIPSFSTSGDASSPGRSPADARRRKPGVTVIGTSRSGGALNHYGVLPGSRVYTIYIDTDAGTAVLEYSAADTSGKEFAQDLIAPEAVRAEIPADLRSAKFVVSCVVDRSGLLRNLRVLQNSSPTTVTRVLAMLHEWRFRPVLRGNAAIEVNAIVGFNIDTR
jgi:hypothetical protein